MSVAKQCRDLKAGDHVYIECETVAQAQNVTRKMTANSRLPGEMKEFKFTCVTYTAIALQSGNVIYLNKVTRIE